MCLGLLGGKVLRVHENFPEADLALEGLPPYSVLTKKSAASQGEGT